MYEFSYFVHIAGITLWIGSFLAFGWLLMPMLESGSADQAGQQVRRLVNRLILPSSFLVVLSGSYMISQFDRSGMPLYLSLMEMGGTMIVLLSIIALTLLSRKISGAVQEDKKASLYRLYRMALFSSAVLALGIVFIVALRLI